MLTDTKIAAIRPPKSGQEEHADHKVTGLRLRVGTGGKKTWTLRRRAGAKVINRKLGTYPAMSLAAARVAAETIIAALERDGSTEGIDRTFGDLADRWVIYVRDEKKNSAWKLQQRLLEMHVLPHWRDRKLTQLRRADVRDLIDSVDGEILPNRVLAAVKTALRYAVGRDWIDASPAEGVAKPKAESPRDRVLTMDELARIWAAADLAGFPFGHYAKMLMLTAQRRTEVAGMRWADLDLKAATWTLSAEDTKADRAHVVPLSAPAVAILEALPELGPYVFTNDGRTHLKDYAKGKHRLERFIAAKGEGIEAWTLHDLRRSAATHMVRLGVSEEVVGRVLNHAKQGVTARVYALHSYVPEKRHALDKWAAELMSEASGQPRGNVVVLRG